MYFGTGANSLKTYYERQSSGRYSVDGTVTDWVKVPYNEARYGRSNGYPCPDIVCSNTWALIKDGIDAWVADQHAKGRTDAQIKADLASYDVWDRNDYDADGDFNEPDGYIDHFQIVHSGGDQADGDPQQGEDAIWSHRWKAFQNLIGTGGPAFNKDGGTQIGTTGLWVADYTIQPENGGLSVFAHEYGHDLGLPDHYDTAGGPDNAVNWWTLMAPEPRVGRERPGDRDQAGRPRRVGQAPARLARLRGRARRPEPHARPRAQRVQQLRGPGRRRAARQEGGPDRVRGAGRGRQAVVVGDRRRPRRLDGPAGDAARRQPGVADLPGALEHRGLRHHAVRLRVRRGQRRVRL